MANINTIKNWFRTGKKPTQQQFWDTWDSFRHKDEKVPAGDIKGIDELLLQKADRAVLDDHLVNANAHAELFLKKEDKAGKGIAGGYAPLNDVVKIAGQYLDIVNDLTSGGVSSLLSAEQGKIIKSQIDTINTILTSNDFNLDTVQEIVDAIKLVQTSLNTILVDDLTTGGITKALTAEQGKVLKGLIDGIKVVDESNLLHKAGDEVKAGTLQVDKIITKNGTSNQYVKGDGTLGNIESQGGGGSIDFANLTVMQAVQISDAIKNIPKYYIREIIGDFKGLAVPLLINGTEKWDCFDTRGEILKYYTGSKPPITVTLREDFAPVLSPGEYVTVEGRAIVVADNEYYYVNTEDFFIKNWYKTVPAGTFVGIYNETARLANKMNICREFFGKKGEDLTEITNPINFEIENTCTDFNDLLIIKIASPGRGKTSHATDGTIISIKPFKEFSVISVQYIWETEERKEKKIELIDKSTSEVIKSETLTSLYDSAYKTFMELRYDFYVNKNFKIKISNI